MINLEEIGLHLSRGQYVPKDVTALLAAAKDQKLQLDPALVERLNKGYQNLGDLIFIFRLLEEDYSEAYGIPTTLERIAEQRAKGEADKLVADEARVRQEAAKIEAEREAVAERLDLAQRAAAIQAMNVAVQAAIDKFNFSQKTAAEIVERRQARSAELKTQLDG